MNEQPGEVEERGDVSDTPPEESLGPGESGPGSGGQELQDEDGVGFESGPGQRLEPGEGAQESPGEVEGEPEKMEGSQTTALNTTELKPPLVRLLRKGIYTFSITLNVSVVPEMFYYTLLWSLGIFVVCRL